MADNTFRAGRSSRAVSLFRISALVALLATLAGTAQPLPAQSPATYFVDDVDATKFPNVTFRLRAVDLNNKVLTGLTNANVPVFENGKQVPTTNVTVTPRDDGPMTIFFVVDQGANAVYNNFSAFSLGAMRKVMSRLIDGGFFRDGRDQVKVLVRENIPVNNDRTVPRQDLTTKASEFSNFVSIYQFENSKGGLTKGLDAASVAIKEIGDAIPEVGRQPAAIVFITNYIEDPPLATATSFATNLAAQAKDKFISIYALQTNAQQFNKPPLEVMAVGSFGKYASISSNTVETVVDDVYRTIAAQRLAYSVSYVSTSGDTTARTITIGGPEKPNAGRTGTFTAKPQSAVLRLDGLPTAVVRREARPGSSQSNPQYDPLTLKVSASITYTDGLIRPLVEARLLVNNVVKSTQTQFQPGASKVDFTVDLSDITTPGTNNVTIGVRIKDSLGIEASNQDRMVIEVLRPPEPSPTPTPPPKGLLESDAGIIALMAAAIVLGLAVGVVVLVIARRGRAARPAPPPMRVSASGPAPGGATLMVAEGPPELQGRHLALDKPDQTLGRGEQADLQFYAGQESSISRIHARITRDGSGTYRLTDLGSSNGSRIGARPLTPNQAYPLQNSDEITLGDISRRGVRLVFNLGGAGYMPPAPSYGQGDDRTRVQI